MRVSWLEDLYNLRRLLIHNNVIIYNNKTR